jgi:signal transduction histidine kinase/CheY-like chemotaxis protein
MVRPAPPTAEELADARQTALRWLAAVDGVLALAILVGLELLPAAPRDVMWVGGMVLLGGSLLVLVWAPRWPAVAGTLLIALLLLLPLGSALALGSTLPLYALPLSVLTAGLVAGPWLTLLVVGLGLGGTLVLTAGTGLAAWIEVVWPLFLTAAAGGLVGLGMRPWRGSLVWAWESYARLLPLTETLRQQRAELAEALKSLNHAYAQLEQVSAELARARAAADEARRLKAEFAANLSHELRTPLNLIIGFSEMMLFAPHTYDHAPLPESYRHDVEAIYRNAQHLSALIDDVLELGEIEAGRMGLRKEWADLREIVEEAVTVVATLFEDRGLRLTLDLPADLPPLYVDRTRLRQVFINLLNNAARFTDHGGVTVRAWCEPPDVRVAVADTGIGISPRDLPHVFEEFRQFESARQRRAGGTGLGLAICKKFVELHGGSIWVESTPGQGTTFFFTLPLATNVAGLPARAPWQTWARLASDPATAPAVLVVSADPGPARLFQRHLDGYRVIASDQPTERPPEPVKAVIRVLDQQDDLAQVLQEPAPRQVPVILCRLPSERDLRQELQVLDYLVKPFTRQRLQAALARIPPHVRHILVVDDDPAMAELLSRALRASERDFRVWKVHDGQTALEVLQRGDPPVDLVLLDLLMPPPDGLTVLRALRADPRLAALPIIVVSARGFIDRGIAASLLAVTHRQGLAIRDLMASTRALLRTLAP